MSVQLVIYPQWENGVVDPFVSVPTTQMIVNPYNFTAIGTGLSITGTTAQTAQNTVSSVFPTIIPNTWYAGFTSGSGVQGSLSGMLFYAPAASCMLQQLSGLVTNALYDVTITWLNSLTPQPVTLKIFNGTTFVSQVVAVPTASDDATVQFTAPSINSTIVLIEYISATNPIVITSVSVRGAEEQPTTTIDQPSNGSVICDLYEDEDIPLTLSVDNFKNAAEKVQSYSKAFNLPGTKRNNLIFDNIFEITRNTEINSILFNPLKRTKAVLKQDGFLIFEGYMRMLDISIKNGETSYNINLYAEVTALVDILKDKTFQDLGFTELEHEYNRTQIEKSWNSTGSGMTWTNPGTSGFRSNTQTIKYPFVDWNHQMVVSNGILGIAGDPELQTLEQAFRPWISIKYLVERIFSNSPFTYTSTFFNTSLFSKLFMDFNWGAEAWGASPERNNTVDQKNTSDQSLTNVGVWTTIALPTNYGGVTDLWDNTNYRFVSDVTNLEVSGDFRVYGKGTALVTNGAAGTWRIAKFDSYGNVLEELKREDFTTTSAAVIFDGSFGTTLQVGEYIEIQIYLTVLINFSINNSTITSYIEIDYNNEAFQVSTLLDAARADINQWEFLKGIMTMFNLIAIPDPNDINNLIIETYENIFIKTSNNQSETLADRGIAHNWTEKVDYSTMKIAPLSDLKGKTIFKFVEDEDDYVFNIYKRDTQGHLYGSKVFDAVYSYELSLLEGQDEVVAEPFAATVIKPLMSQYPEFVVPSVYAMSDDGETEGFDNSPRIMYDNGFTNLSSMSYYIPEQNGVAGQIKYRYLQFSHLTDTPSAVYSNDFNFGVCQLIPPFTPVTNNLFQMYWMPYYSELYNANTRVVTVKINLNSGDINTFKFNDQVMIKNRAYRVNKINYKPNDFATVELILLNYI